MACLLIFELLHHFFKVLHNPLQETIIDWHLKIMDWFTILIPSMVSKNQAKIFSSLLINEHHDG